MNWYSRILLLFFFCCCMQTQAAPVGFIIIGDTGTGSSKQYHVANAMEEVCDKELCQFALGLGDNIYEYGPRSAVDAQFQSKFEKPFKNLNFPFLMALGNHDASLLFPGDGAYSYKGVHEVAYSEISSKWVMPARYYSTEVENVLFVAIDTTPLGKSYLPDINRYFSPWGAYAKEQKQWVVNEIVNSTAQWKFVFGHHPYINNGISQIEPSFGGAVYRKFFEQSVCGKVDFILAGHDHSLQIIKEVKSCPGTQHIISGAGAKNLSWPLPFRVAPKYWSNYFSLGFFHALINGNQLTLKAYVVQTNGDHALKYQRSYFK